MTKRIATVNLKKSESNLATGIVLIFIANVINLLFSIGTNLILPKFLSVESYAAIKTYQLYITYVGVLHFGFNDGMYLKYGGKSFNELNKSDVLNNLSTLRIFQVVVTVICIGVSVALKDAVLLMASIVIFPMNLKAYYQSLYQAIGEFGIYSKIMNTVTGVTFFINAILVFFFKTDNYIYYLILYVALNFVIWIALEFLFQKKAGCHIRWMVFDWKELVNQIKAGVLIMLGNFSDSIMTSMDRWFVKIFVGTVAFAQYAFAVSMEHFLSVAVSPLSITLYNYLCKNIPNYKLKKLRGAILIFSAFLVCSAFPVVFILEHFMTNYVDGVICGYIDPCQRPYQQICDALDLPCYGTKDQFFYMTDKHAFKKMCMENGVDVIPEYTEEEALSGQAEFPLFVKPVDSRGSRGQSVCYTTEQLENAINFAKSESSNGDILIEKYMKGAHP